MQVEPSDVHQTLEYRADAEFASWLPIGLLTCFCGLFLFALAMPELPPLGETIGAAAAIPTGLGITVFALWRRFRRGRPVYVLAPEGIVIRVAFVKDIVIPWREIQAVDTIEITFRHWMAWRSRVLHYPDVTVVLVSRRFYDAHIFIDSLFLRGPYWHEGKFIQKGELVQCALHHEVVSAEPRAARGGRGALAGVPRSAGGAHEGKRRERADGDGGVAESRRQFRRANAGAAHRGGQRHAAADLVVGGREDRASADRNRRGRGQPPRAVGDGRADQGVREEEGMGGAAGALRGGAQGAP